MFSKKTVSGEGHLIDLFATTISFLLSLEPHVCSPASTTIAVCDVAMLDESSAGTLRLEPPAYEQDSATLWPCGRDGRQSAYHCQLAKRDLHGSNVIDQPDSPSVLPRHNVLVLETQDHSR